MAEHIDLSSDNRITVSDISLYECFNMIAID